MKPLVFAHRGASACAPENTLAAFRLAFEMGADGIELDVNLTRDGVPIVYHEDDDPAMPTHGFKSLRHLSVKEVQSLDAGSWFSDAYGGEPIPTLEQVLDKFANRGIINIELKYKEISLRNNRLEAAVAGLVRNLPGNVLVSSFHPLALARLAVMSPKTPRALIHQKNLPIFLRDAWLRRLARPSWIHPDTLLVSKTYMSWARQQGYRVTVWHPEEETEMRRIVSLGVEGIMSNRPDLLRRVVDEN